MATGSGDWDQDDSTFFLQYGDVITPSRQEQIDMLVSLVPAESSEEFTAVDLACGAGHLSAALLQAFARCRILALDGAPEMLAAALDAAGDHKNRLETRQFDLRRSDWLESITDPVRCFVSSLSIHHLDGVQKRILFSGLLQGIEPGGALLIADLVEPVNERARVAYAANWDSLVKEQVVRTQGSLAAYDRFRDGWNHYITPDPDFDKPSNLFAQLQWLTEAGFADVDCFWLRAGHAIYGGYRRS